MRRLMRSVATSVRHRSERDADVAQPKAGDQHRPLPPLTTEIFNMSKDAESAFPNLFSDIALRDYFAGLAMQSLIDHPNGTVGQWLITARDAYKQADAMLEARKL